MMKQILFFATPNDIRPVISALDTTNKIAFARVGSYDVKDPPMISGPEIPNPGFATNETASGSVSYLAVPAGSRLNVHPYTSEDSNTFGKKMWSVYSGFNDESVELTLAGIWEDGTLLPGSVKAMHNNEFSKKIMRDFQSSLKKARFEKAQSWWLGTEAVEMLRAGKRLSTTAVQSPPEYDLRPEHLG
ncbi:UNVERIFIED_ORG: hypothetical protein GGI57_004709 [Rhizobium aethiopicum]|uniref:hypothetical protein n=1 Tax=unclassified Rhizobium TaxID=2613769 RepID=UPI0008DA30E6|nr:MULTISPECIES: hypothetical protein [unclassified Rhizobium]OHV18824.1 hypothetical protein BBJ66_18815 [Rhizobium sp. RSm-3]RVU10461.1 hypothetical protein EOS93_13860 [Rhizobium sp. RMa-01]